MYLIQNHSMILKIKATVWIEKFLTLAPSGGSIKNDTLTYRLHQFSPGLSHFCTRKIYAIRIILKVI